MIVKPGEKVTWSCCKKDWALAGSLILSSFKIKGTDCCIFLSNECPMFGSAQARSGIFEDGSKVVTGGLKYYRKVHFLEAHSNH
jgi:hypothetical protein